MLGSIRDAVVPNKGSYEGGNVPSADNGMVMGGGHAALFTLIFGNARTNRRLLPSELEVGFQPTVAINFRKH